MSNPYSTPLTRALQAYRRLDLSHYPPKRLRRQPVRRRAIRLNREQVERLVAGYCTGVTVSELGAEFGISRKTVARRLKAAGVVMQRSSHTPTQVQIDEMVRLYKTGASLDVVGQRLGFAARTVERHLEAQGVERRDTHGRSRI